MLVPELQGKIFEGRLLADGPALKKVTLKSLCRPCFYLKPTDLSSVLGHPCLFSLLCVSVTRYAICGTGSEQNHAFVIVVEGSICCYNIGESGGELGWKGKSLSLRNCMLKNKELKKIKLLVLIHQYNEQHQSIFFF